MLTHNSALQGLDLHSNRIEDAGVLAIASVLKSKKNTTLR
jgi:hypothetical protein